MRFVTVKSAEQQAALMLHKTRELLIKQRTMTVNAIRGHLAEFGIIVAKGVHRVDELLDLARANEALPAAAKATIDILARELDARDEAIGEIEDKIAEAHHRSDVSQLLDGVPGVGIIIASVIAATIPDPSVFKSGRDFAAWLGLTPRQNSSGGKASLGGVTKKGNRYIRKLLVLAATSIICRAGGRTGALADWITKLKPRNSSESHV